MNKHRGFGMYAIVALVLAIGLVAIAVMSYQTQQSKQKGLEYRASADRIADDLAEKQRLAEQNAMLDAQQKQERIRAEKQIEAKRDEERQARAAGLEQLKAKVKQWNDASELAHSAPRISLARPVADLQMIRRDTNALGVSKCLAYAKSKLVEGMDAEIDGIKDFLGDADMSFMALAGLLKRKDAFEAYDSSASKCA